MLSILLHYYHKLLDKVISNTLRSKNCNFERSFITTFSFFEFSKESLCGTLKESFRILISDHTLFYLHGYYKSSLTSE